MKAESIHTHTHTHTHSNQRSFSLETETFVLQASVCGQVLNLIPSLCWRLIKGLVHLKLKIQSLSPQPDVSGKFREVSFFFFFLELHSKNKRRQLSPEQQNIWNSYKQLVWCFQVYSSSCMDPVCWSSGVCVSLWSSRNVLWTIDQMLTHQRQKLSSCCLTSVCCSNRL